MVRTLTRSTTAPFDMGAAKKEGIKEILMKSKVRVMIACLLVLTVLAQTGVALGGDSPAPQESTITTLPDGSIVIEGYIKYDRALGYVVQALKPEGNFGRYIISNPDDQLLEKLSKQGDMVLVQGRQTGASFALEVQTINGKAYR